MVPGTREVFNIHQTKAVGGGPRVALFFTRLATRCPSVSTRTLRSWHPREGMQTVREQPASFRPGHQFEGFRLLACRGVNKTKLVMSTLGRWPKKQRGYSPLSSPGAVFCPIPEMLGERYGQ